MPKFVAAHTQAHARLNMPVIHRFPGARHKSPFAQKTTMKPCQFPRAEAPAKAPTGLSGLDEITGGGLPQARTILLCTSPHDEMTGQSESGSQLQISALADTWILLNDLMRAGARMCGLSIVKSRGTAHTIQLRGADATVTNARVDPP